MTSSLDYVDRKLLDEEITASKLRIVRKVVKNKEIKKFLLCRNSTFLEFIAKTRDLINFANYDADFNKLKKYIFNSFITLAHSNPVPLLF